MKTPVKTTTFFYIQGSIFLLMLLFQIKMLPSTNGTSSTLAINPEQPAHTASLSILPAGVSLKSGTTSKIILQLDNDGAWVENVSVKLDYQSQYIHIDSLDFSGSPCINVSRQEIESNVIYIDCTTTRLPHQPQLQPLININFSALTPGQTGFQVDSSSQLLSQEGNIFKSKHNNFISIF
jgi:hypothetical protein